MQYFTFIINTKNIYEKQNTKILNNLSYWFYGNDRHVCM